MAKKILIIGAGGVAGVFTAKAGLLCNEVPPLEEYLSNITVAGRRTESCEKIRRNVKELTGKEVAIRQIDADNVKDLVVLIKEGRFDLVVNLATPTTDLAVMSACLIAGVPYLDTANYEPKDDPNFRYEWQWGLHSLFEHDSNLAILGGGFDPGAVSIYVMYAFKHLFKEIHCIDILDCNAGNHGYKFATNFDPQTNIREVTKKGTYWEDGEYITIDPIVGEEPGRISFRALFNYPEIGPVDTFVIHHEEIQSIVKALKDKGLRRVRFGMTFGKNYLTHLWALKNVGMTNIVPMEIAPGVEISPLDFLAKVLPDPSSLGERYTGKTCIGCRMEGIGKEGFPKKVFIYNVCDHKEQAYREVRAQAISYTTAIPAIVISVLMLDGTWTNVGVRNVEEFDPDPAMKLMNEFGLTWKILEGNDVPDIRYTE